MTHLPGGPCDPDDLHWRGSLGKGGRDRPSTSIDRCRTRGLCIDSDTALPGTIVGTDGWMKIEGVIPVDELNRCSNSLTETEEISL